MKNLKKILAVLLAVMMVAALSVTALADNDNTYAGSNQPEATAATDTAIPFNKTIVVFNTDESAIREPNITYTYAVEPIDTTAANQGKALAGVTVTDSNNNTVTVLDGVAGGVTGTSISFAETNSAATYVNGNEIEKNSTLGVDLSVFERAGVYRYKITETTNVTPESVGITRDATGYDATRYLDLYVGNKTGGGFEVLGAVIFKTTNTQAGTEGKDSITTTTEKTTGFEPGTDGTPGTTDYTNDTTVDRYFTYNVEVKKTTSGALADKTNDFPFEITITGDKAATIVADYAATGATYVGTVPTTINVNTTPVVLTPALSDGDSVKITGLPIGTTVLVKETNNTPDKYVPTIDTQTGFTGLELTVTAALDTNESTQLKTSPEITDKTQNSVIGLTNTIQTISPTGVVMRFAPFAIILAAGCMLLLVARKRREAED